MFKTFARRHEYAAVLVGLFFIYSAYTWPLLTVLGRGISGPSGDSIGSIYDLWSLDFFSASPIGTYTNTLIGYPVGVIVHGTASISAILIQFPAVILTKVFNEIFAFNFMACLGFVLPPFFMYVLLRRREIRFSVSCYGALGFLFFPFHLYSFMSWPSLAQTAWLPICQIFLDDLYRNQRKTRWLIPFGIAVFASMSNGYVGLMTFVVALVGYGNLLFLQKDLKLRIRKILHRKSALFASISLSVMFLLVVLMMISAVRKEVVRSKADLQVYGLRLSDLFLPVSNSLFKTPLTLASRTRSLHGSNEVETAQFLGYGTISLAMYWIVVSVRQRKLRVSLPEISLAVVAIWFGMSQGISVIGLELPNPAEMLTKVAPFWRAYGRFGTLIMFAFLLLACRSLESISSKLQGPRRILLVGLAIVILLIELPVRLPNQTMQFKTPEFVTFLSREQGAVIHYPLAKLDDGMVYQRRFWQRIHRLPMINGYIDTDKNLTDNRLDDIRRPAISGKLTSLGVNWVIVDWSLYEGSGGSRILGDPLLKKRFAFGDTEIFENLSRSSIPIVYIKDGVFPQEIGIGNLAFNWMGSRTTIEVIGGKSECVRVELMVRPFIGMKNLVIRNRSKRVATVSSGLVEINLRLNKGHQTLELSSDMKPVQIPGNDPRAVTFQLSELKVSPTSRC